MGKNKSFVDINIEILPGISSVIAVTETCRYFFSKNCVSWINCDTFCKFMKVLKISNNYNHYR